MNMKEENLKVQNANDTQQNFLDLHTQTKHKNNHRMKSLYSFNLFDHPDFKQSQKVEKRINKYYTKKERLLGGKRLQSLTRRVKRLKMMKRKNSIRKWFYN